jgi:poly(A) polymerase
MSKPIQYLGVTPPIATSGPSVQEISATESLMEELKNIGVFESSEEARMR